MKKHLSMRNSVRKFGAVLVAGMCVAFSVPAQAQFAFDFDGREGFTRRDKDFAPAAYISQVEQDLTITSISVLNDLENDGALRFLVMDADTRQFSYLSGAQNAVDDGLSWKTSDSFAYTLQAGHRYVIGAMANVGARWAYSRTSPGFSEAGLTMSSANRNVSLFLDPTLSGAGQSLIPLRLTAMASAIPEVRGSIMMLAGLGVLLWLGRRRGTKR